MVANPDDEKDTADVFPLKGADRPRVITFNPPIDRPPAGTTVVNETTHPALFDEMASLLAHLLTERAAGKEFFDETAELMRTNTRLIYALLDHNRKVADEELTVAQAADLAGVTGQTIINWCQRYGIGAAVNGRWVVS